ncbi:MAG: YraN family protein [Planctomycetota bacterium]
MNGERRPLWSRPADLLRGVRNKIFGDRGERAAVVFLRRAGLKIVATNVRNVGGEIDVIARDGDVLVFVEVKTRTSAFAGTPAEAVTADKRRRLTRAAAAEMKRRRWHGRRCRFDVLALLWPEGEGSPDVTHYRHAFEADDSVGPFA